MISRETIDSVMSLRERIADPEKKALCIADLETMIRTKESHLARAEWGSCCGNICNLASQIDGELKILQNTLEALIEGDFDKAICLLDDYIAILKRNYSQEPDHW